MSACREAPAVAACVVNWNTRALTSRCLDALQAQRPPPHRIIVVDNDSCDDSLVQLRASHPAATFVAASGNLGFAAAVALAAREAADCDALWLVNSDAIPDPDALAALVSAWRTHGDALYGSATLRRDADGADWLELPRKFLSPAGRWSPWRRDAPLRFDADWMQAPPRRVGALLGSSLLVPSAVLRAHGGMDPDWFLHCEEIDWCLRLGRAGVPSWLVPDSRVHHGGGGSHDGRAGVADGVAYYRARNEIVLARRHLGRGAAAIVAGKKLLRALATAALRRARAGAQLRGVRDAVLGRMGKRVAPEARLHDELDQALRDHSGRLPWRALRRVRGSVSATVTHRVERSRLHYAAQTEPFLRAWRQTCIDRLARALARSDAALELAFEDVPRRHAPGALRIGLQWEHALVRPGGRDSDGAPPGATALPDAAGRYLARLARRAELEACDLVFEYSTPNRVHLQRSGLAQYAARSLVISPQPWAPDFDVTRRDLDLVTLMHDLCQPRRARWLAEARRAGLPLRNVRGVYAPDQLRALLRRTRVLVNLHQTDEHHSFEELRVLPALLCGVVVVSEEVPLREHIPYAEFVLWSSRDALLDTVRAVAAAHAEWHARLFGDGRLERVLARMRADEDAALEAALARLARGAR